ncbi:sensor histidine kinase [Paenibacillus antri]|uniref:histidine kinase n=1 Tax=Paenibacillus antri TaxID=2582848 RepID=A0A5R9G680_9BACL|nr:sensor histidine kinase [Paenibacillus antri]TLS49610.1 sensor histidine kinase [Paenibacillus antri]
MLRKSIQTKMFVAFSAVMLFALLSVGLIIYWNLTENIKANAIQYVTDSLRRADENLNVLLEDTSLLLTTVAANEENVIDVLRSPHFEVSYEWVLEQKKIENFLSYLVAYKSHISRISVVDRNGKIFFVGAPWLDASNLNAPLFERFLASTGQQVLFERAGQSKTLVIGRGIQYSESPNAAVMIDLNYEVIENAYNIKPSEDSHIYVIDEDGDFVFNTNGQVSENNVFDSPLSGVFGKLLGTNSVGETEVEGKPHLVVSYKSEKSGWTTIGTIPEHALIQDSIRFRHTIAQVVLLAFVVALFVSIAISSQITKNLKRLRNAMLWVHDGNLSVSTKIDAEDEVGQLNELFIRMLDKIRTLVEDMKQRERQKREAELMALQAQIKPHFLYNTLNTIKYMAHLQHAKNIEEVSTSLTDLLRGVLGNTREFVTLQEELDYVKSYVNIQRYRFVNQFDIHYDIEPELSKREVLKLILQPLVENAIYHGISPLGEPGLIQIRAYREEGRMKIEVADTGVGMTEEQIAKAFDTDVMQDNVRRGGMGIMNVHERIRMVYGEAYGLSLYSRHGSFTKAVVTIPLERMAEAR